MNSVASAGVAAAREQAEIAGTESTRSPATEIQFVTMTKGRSASSSTLRRARRRSSRAEARRSSPHGRAPTDEVDPKMAEKRLARVAQAETHAFERERDDVGRKGQPDRRRRIARSPVRSDRRRSSPSDRRFERSTVPLSERSDFVRRDDHPRLLRVCSEEHAAGDNRSRSARQSTTFVDRAEPLLSCDQAAK